MTKIEFCLQHTSVVLCKFIALSTVIAPAKIEVILFLISFIRFRAINDDLPLFQHSGIIKGFPAL